MGRELFFYNDSSGSVAAGRLEAARQVIPSFNPS